MTSRKLPQGALLIVAAVIRLVGVDGAARDVSAYARDHGVSGQLSETLRSAFDTAQSAPAPSAGLLGLAGVLSLVYGASRAFTAVGRALDTMGGSGPVARPLRRRAQDLAWTLGLVAIGIAMFVILLVSGEVLEDLLGLVGLSGAAVPVWAAARWPVAFALLLCSTAIVKWTAPTGTRPAFRLFAPGTLVSVTGWFAASVGFSVYVGHFASYNATYGAFAGAVIVLLWIWLGGAALLYGAELDAEIADERPAGPVT